MNFMGVSNANAAEHGVASLDPHLDSRVIQQVGRQRIPKPVKQPRSRQRIRNAQQILLMWQCLFSGMHAKFWFRRLLEHSENFIGDSDANVRRLAVLLLSRAPAGIDGALSITRLAALSNQRGENITIRETWKLLGADYRDHVVVGICARDFQACFDYEQWGRTVLTGICADTQRDFRALLQHSFRHSVGVCIAGAWESRGRHKRFARPSACRRNREDMNQAYVYGYCLVPVPFMWPIIL